MPGTAEYTVGTSGFIGYFFKRQAAFHAVFLMR